MRAGGQGPDPVADAYAAAVAGRLRDVLGADLVGVYLHGSAVLGGWLPQTSDLDLLAVAAGPPAAAARRAVAERLTDPALPCPAAHGLEFSLVTAAAAGTPSRSPRFELHVGHATGATERRPGFPERLPATRVVDGTGTAGDPDLLLCFEVCRRAGRSVLGPPPAEVFAAPPRAWLLEAAAGELRWAAGHASFAYRVLTACRAWRFLDEDALGSKLAGGAWARSRLADPGLVDLAVAAQRGEVPMPLGPARLAAADRLLGEVLARLDGAAPGPPP
jgi:Domain of unknown function (DUF4111)